MSVSGSFSESDPGGACRLGRPTVSAVADVPTAAAVGLLGLASIYKREGFRPDRGVARAALSLESRAHHRHDSRRARFLQQLRIFCAGAPGYHRDNAGKPAPIDECGGNPSVFRKV